MRVLYVETSALAQAYLHGEEALRETMESALASADAFSTSTLTGVELRRAAAQLVARGDLDEESATAAVGRALAVLTRADVVPLTEDVLTRAGGAFPLPIRTLDALHVATALQVQLRPEITAVVMLSRDKRVREVAAAMGIQLV